MSKDYKEPELSILILDYAKPVESYMLLQSIKKHVKVPYKVIFCDNGSNDGYSFYFLKDRFVDQLIINKESLGLGIGTRDLFAACTSPYAIYCQNDQVFSGDLTEEYFDWLKNAVDKVKMPKGERAKTISLAGYPCGQFIYSERCHFIKTDFYKSLEPLTLGGAGFLHHLKWREQEIQEIYKKQGYFHFAGPQIVSDNGVFAVRDMMKSGGGVWCHRTDNKNLWCIVPPDTLHTDYPKFTEGERQIVLSSGWPDKKIPENELAHSFDCWSGSPLGQMENDYIKDLKLRFKKKYE